MVGSLGNPFMNNTPSSSPVKDSENNRVSKRPVSNLSSSSTSVLSSPSRRPRTSGSVIYSDRFLPNRTAVNLNAITSIGNPVNLAPHNTSKTEDQVEIQKERQSHATFDAILKNELFGEMLQKDTIGSESSIGRIQNTRPGTADAFRSTYPSERSSHSNSGARFQNSSDNNIQSNDYSESEAGDGAATPPDAEIMEYSSSTSVPVTPSRLFSTVNDDLYRPSTATARGASLLTYSERTGRRTSVSSLMQSQFFDSLSPVRPDSKQLLLSPTKKFRQIAKVPYRVLDAPCLADDFYYDLIDWSSTDILAVGLGKSIFLTDNGSGEVVHLCDTENEYTSLSWVGAGSHLAVGQGNGLVEIYDVVKRKCVRTLSGHVDRVACLSWNGHILTSGSRDHNILHRDVRMPDPFFERLNTHSQEVCGLQWNTEENKLASGGNDNVVCVYDGTSRNPMIKFIEHKAAVKALAWSPHKRGILATGGGTVDRRLKTWNVNTSMKLSDVDTGSQVCNMIWSKNTDEIVTSHGYSKYHLTLWDYPTMNPVAILKGHSFRVLHLTLSADGTTVVSGAGDETLRYWKLFEKSKPRAKPDSIILNAFNQIR
ncbi:hypothetical protein NCAS_0J01110 [Naumovozyma castellii]|uniref:CDC20/Fizzy WD40 domain-containing protein n=1 Tax=Naumovozyma castellii TaxID=27288 RepID=G0VKQ2_NAUCA|nr:hypothetical protein NCAS_0J01110 [Naumovozyma castellii CBS 4309]CCC72090.1 hypothetical protein NCAS_0J01110 [Naumovozyma castellii CBS 4309]